MGEVYKKYFQKCDICKTEFSLKDETDQLHKIRIPMDYVSEYKTSITIQNLSVCEDCLVKIKGLFSKGLVVRCVEWGGVQCEWKDEAEQ